MFKKLKDKLAEEVKSSPQKFQQFAQAAQAAVTSASSSISDITNSDLFSIGDNDGSQSRQARPQSSQSTQPSMFQDVSLMQPNDSMDFTQENMDGGQRQRRLSNSSFASDVSFRLPSYETPSMYHLQSDMEVSASEADDRGFAGGPATLDRVTKEQLYAAYRRTQERYKKYRTQYGDLARHYKLLERENAKARSVLVETQDKALRRISELKEQCSLEQSAKAHLEKALRIEMDEKNMKIDTLNTKIQLLQNETPNNNAADDNSNQPSENQNEVQLINLLDNGNTSKTPSEDITSEVVNLNSKIEKLEQLVNKYKESLKSSKEKNAQVTTELQILSKELDNKNKQIQDFKTTEDLLNEAKTKIEELSNQNEELQNQINTFDFTKTKQLSTLELDLQKAKEEIVELRGKIEVFTKREEENAISLAENKLSIHKELESKEAEIKSLKDSLSQSKKEIQSLKIVIDDYKNNITGLEEEKTKLSKDCEELGALKSKFSEMETKLQELTKKSVSLEQLKAKTDEEYKCLQLQLKQETAEKLAMIDRNAYLESKNTQLAEENTKKSARVNSLEGELKLLANNKDIENDSKETEKYQLLQELNTWKDKCEKLEFEIQEEREELVKLQTEIEKLLSNHELIQTQNVQYRSTVSELTSECSNHQEQIIRLKSLISSGIHNSMEEIKHLREIVLKTSKETQKSIDLNKDALSSMSNEINTYLSNTVDHLLKSVTVNYNKLKLDYDKLQTEMSEDYIKKSDAFNNMNVLEAENNNLKIKLQENESEISSLNDKFKKASDETNAKLETIKSLEIANQTIKQSLEEIKETSHGLQTGKQAENSQHLADIEKLHIEKEKFMKTIQELELKHASFNKEIKKIEEEHKNALEEIKINHENILKIKEQEIEKLSLDVQNIEEKHKDALDEVNTNIENISKTKDQEIEKLSLHVQNIQVEHKDALEKIKINHEKTLKIREQEIEKLSLQAHDDLKAKSTQLSQALEQSKHLDMEKNELNKTIKTLQNDNIRLVSELEKSRNELTTVTETVKSLNTEIVNLSNDLEKSKQNQITLQEEITKFKMTDHTIAELKGINQDLTEKLRSVEDTNNTNHLELENLRGLYKTAENNINELNLNMTKKLNECEAKHTRVLELEDSIRKLTQENISLQTETSNFASNMKMLESEIDEIRNSHTEIETEKDRLSKIIEELETKEKEHSLKESKDTQTGVKQDNSLQDQPTSTEAFFENKWVLENKQSAMSHTASLNLKKENQEDLYEQYCALKINYDTLKDENRRLQSDIEGLQTYLTKVSKENSVLNDKLRELLASSEHSADTDQISNDVKELKNEIQAGKEKINDLLRENSFLIEENLELKDQLQSQNYSKPEESKPVSNDKDLDIIKSKYDNLCHVNNQLEKQNVDLEQINKSVSGNMQQLQDKNERLKLSNEKLERRLDEALVSLRHLHSLQENTELEYLRNILYEYLTGTGTHSVTLAKVLAAIVKFDPEQTQLVMQKEKERQGFLRQLGII